MALTNPAGTATAAPGAEVLALAQELLERETGGAPFIVEVEGKSGSLHVEGQPEEPLRWDDEAMALWEEVDAERQQAYQACFGPFPDELHKLETLVGFWPGGALVQISTGEGVVSASFGLSNYGLPTPVGVYQGIDGDGQPVAELGPRPRRLTPAGAAGYGYELLIWTEEIEGWPLLVLGRLAEKELLEDADFLGLVHQYGAVTMHGLPIGAERAVQALLGPAADPLPEGLTLANGRCEFLTATLITLAELEFALEHGGPALAQKLAEAGVGQFSSLERESVI